MARVDPLESAAALYASRNWGESEWREFGRETGSSDVLSNHPRLYRSLSFADDDYPEAAVGAFHNVFRELAEDYPSEKGRMELLADLMPELPAWVEANAPARTRRLFGEYIAARDFTEIPAQWISAYYTADEEAVEATADADIVMITEPASFTLAPETEAASPTPNPTSALLPTAPPAATAPATASQPSIFMVHGHDSKTLDSVRIYVSRHTGVLPISLAEEPGQGDTIIEKFERHGVAASFVIVLLTPDDVGQTAAAHNEGIDPNPRARQNVVLELGYFIGQVGRRNIVVIDAGVERPSDINGVSYIEYPGQWKDDLRNELQAAGLLKSV